MDFYIKKRVKARAKREKVVGNNGIGGVLALNNPIALLLRLQLRGGRPRPERAALRPCPLLLITFQNILPRTALFSHFVTVCITFLFIYFGKLFFMMEMVI